jgi:hypothetical protein
MKDSMPFIEDQQELPFEDLPEETEDHEEHTSVYTEQMGRIFTHTRGGVSFLV